MQQVTVISFGFGHGAPPQGAHQVLDVRVHFKDPHVRPELRYMTARDEAVVQAVKSTPGVERLVNGAVLMAEGYEAAPTSAPLVIAVGCVGGRHRSAVIAEWIAERLARSGWDALVEHRDIDREVIERTETGELLKVHGEWAGTTDFAVYPNEGAQYVMACTCARCRLPLIAWAADADGPFQGVCACGQRSTTWTSVADRS